MMAVDDGDVVGDSAEHTCNIVRVCQRIKVELEAHETPPSRPGQTDEIWALLEFETINPDQPELLPGTAAKRNKKWKKFDSEHDLQDFIRRDTGEPLVVPPYSLTPQQSASIERDSAQKVSQITEEFRRFRVKSEMARKQADAQLRELQNKSMKSAQLEIDGPQDSSVSPRIESVILCFDCLIHVPHHITPHHIPNLRRMELTQRNDLNNLK